MKSRIDDGHLTFIDYLLVGIVSKLYCIEQLLLKTQHKNLP